MSNFDGIPRGAYTELEDLIKLRLLARELSLTPLLRPRSSTSGIRQSSHRGRGVDFEEVRIYQPGDDVRSIDWRVTARTSKVHTKVFREEKERPVFILVDQRRPMFFGSRHCCKSVQAAWLAALIAWISLQRADQVGGLVLGEDALNEIRPRRSHHTVLRMLQEIHRQNRFLQRALEQTQAHDICRALSDLRRTMHPGVCCSSSATAATCSVRPRFICIIWRGTARSAYCGYPMSSNASCQRLAVTCTQTVNNDSTSTRRQRYAGVSPPNENGSRANCRIC